MDTIFISYGVKFYFMKLKRNFKKEKYIALKYHQQNLTLARSIKTKDNKYEK